MFLGEKKSGHLSDQAHLPGAWNELGILNQLPAAAIHISIHIVDIVDAIVLCVYVYVIEHVCVYIYMCMVLLYHNN